MSARLFCRYGTLKGSDFEIDDEASVGRADTNTVMLADTKVSKTHARIVHDADRGCFVLTDLGSTNGTLLDGDPIVGDERLGVLHVISFGGGSDFIFIDRELMKKSRPAPTGASADRAVVAEPVKSTAVREAKQADKSVTALVPAPDNRGAETDPLRPAAMFALEVIKGDAVVARFDLADGEFEIGRGAECAIRIDSQALSKRHALIRIRGPSVFVRDLGSTNGTFVRDRRLRGSEEVKLTTGERAFFGEMTARVVEI